MQSHASRFGKLAAFGAAALVGGSAALAEVSDVVFRVTAQNDDGIAVFEARQGDVTPAYEGYFDGDGNYIWQMFTDIPLMSAGGIEIGRILVSHTDDQGRTVATGQTLIEDPQISFGFAVQAGNSTTFFDMDSALLSFSPIPGAVGLANAAYTVTNFGPVGATMTGLGPDGGAYLAHYNGFVPTGSEFTEQIPSITVATTGSNGASFADPGVGYRSVDVLPVADMSVKAKFSVTRLDFASGTSNYEIVPEPTTAVLLLSIAALALRRR